MRILIALFAAILVNGVAARAAPPEAIPGVAPQNAAVQLADQKRGWKEREKHSKKWQRERRERYEEMEREQRRHEEEMSRERYEHRHRDTGPPPWAPAHGYRAKQERRYRYHYHGRDHYVSEADLVSLPAAGVGRCNRDVIGALIGAGAGGLLGSQFGKGEGKTVTTIAGAILGAVVGGTVGRGMDQVDQSCVGQVLEQAPTGRTVQWQDPDNGRQYATTPTQTYQAKDGRYCREYQTTVTVGGRTERAYGVACRQPDGSWEKVN